MHSSANASSDHISVHLPVWGVHTTNDGLLANRSQRFVACRVLTESAKLDIGSKAPSFTVGAASTLLGTFTPMTCSSSSSSSSVTALPHPISTNRSHREYFIQHQCTLA